MHKDLRFWLAVLAVILFALGTLPTLHGIVCWGLGSLFVSVLYRIEK